MGPPPLNRLGLAPRCSTSSIASAASASAACARFTHLKARAYEHPGTDHGEHAEPDAWLTVPEAATLRDLVFAGAALHDAVERADTEVAGDTLRYPAPQGPGPRVTERRTPGSRRQRRKSSGVSGSPRTPDPGPRTPVARLRRPTVQTPRARGTHRRD